MKKYYIILIAVLFFTSCEDTIDVNLEESNPQLIVDAWLDNNNQRQDLRISRSLPYFTNEFTPGVENALVIVKNNNGTEYQFAHETDGLYAVNLPENEFIGSVGDSFELSIAIDNKNYLAKTMMHRVTPIDSLVQEFRDDEVFTEDGIYCQVFARDFDGLGDSYWIKSFINDQYLNRPFEINIAYDAGFDSGGELDGFVFIYPIRDLINETGDDGIPIQWEVGDKIKVEIHSISNDAFNFLEIMRDQLLNRYNTIFAEPLANTVGNIKAVDSDETVLGVFNVSAVSSVEQIIQ